MKATKLIILDRDGVINHDSDQFIKKPEEWIPIEGSLEAISRLNHAGYRVVVATNQSGIGRGLFDTDTLNRIHQKMHRSLVSVGGAVDAVFFCPHSAEDKCQCRKPKTGLFQEIERRFGIPLKGIPCVGDSLRDLQAGFNAGGSPHLVLTGKGKKTRDNGNLPEGTLIHECLESFVDTLLSMGKQTPITITYAEKA
jgi:D-glycero-D-manno-heptose 1,7-bisphosphate phosphatase